MSIDIYEGAKRLKIVMQAMILTAAVIIAINMDKPPLTLVFETSGPVDRWRLSDRPCSSTSGMEIINELDIGYREKISATLCFRAMKFADGQVLIPYRHDEHYTWGNEDFSSSVIDYKLARQAAFTLDLDVSNQALSKISSQVWQSDLHNLYQTGIYALISCGLLEWLSWSVSWVTKGFLGSRRA